MRCPHTLTVVLGGYPLHEWCTTCGALRTENAETLIEDAQWREPSARLEAVIPGQVAKAPEKTGSFWHGVEAIASLVSSIKACGNDGAALALVDRAGHECARAVQERECAASGHCEPHGARNFCPQCGSEVCEGPKGVVRVERTE